MIVSLNLKYQFASAEITETDRKLLISKDWHEVLHMENPPISRHYDMAVHIQFFFMIYVYYFNFNSF